MSVTCRCRMCGCKNAGSNNQSHSYVRAGIRHAEKKLHGRDKKLTRRLRRRREKRTYEGS